MVVLALLQQHVAKVGHEVFSCRRFIGEVMVGGPLALTSYVMEGCCRGLDFLS